MAPVFRMRPHDQLATTQANDARERVHPEPTDHAGEQQADDNEHQDRRIGGDVDDGSGMLLARSAELAAYSVATFRTPSRCSCSELRSPWIPLRFRCSAVLFP